MKDINEVEKLKINREKAFYNYLNALERGDLDTVQVFLAQAETDPALEQMLLDLNEEYAAEEQAKGIKSEDAGLVKRLLEQYLQTAVKADEESGSELKPLTVLDVLDKMKSDAAMRGQPIFQIEKYRHALRRDATELPGDLSKQSISRLFQQLNLEADPFFQKAFRDAAILLSMGRETHQAQLAAARRQSPRKPGKPRR
jgi:hypothetical protein